MHNIKPSLSINITPGAHFHISSCLSLLNESDDINTKYKNISSEYFMEKRGDGGSLPV